MPEVLLRLDPSRTTLEITTFAEGALSSLAHNLVLRATDVSGTARPGELPTAEVQVAVSGLRVWGVLKHQKVDEAAPSRIERAEIERRIAGDVFPRTTTIEVHAELRGRTAEVTVRWAGGRTTAPFAATLENRSDGTWLTTGEGSLSLPSLGVRPIVGPLRAFRVSDEVRVRWEAVFSAAPA